MTNETQMIRHFNIQTCQWEMIPAPIECEHDDYMMADDYDRRAAMRDGWISDTEGRY
jgi:hypothetical protein